jgi:hypothetical protein
MMAALLQNGCREAANTIQMDSNTVLKNSMSILRSTDEAVKMDSYWDSVKELTTPSVKTIMTLE